MESMARAVVLADGTKLYTDEGAGAASGALWCWLHDITIAEAAALFLDPEKTRVIKFVYGQYMDVFEGFTTVLCFQKTERGANVQLTGEDTRITEHIPAEEECQADGPGEDEMQLNVLDGGGAEEEDGEG